MSEAAGEPVFYAGFVSLLGRPNVGKSTLLNALVGAKVSIVANKPQTTRTAVQGVWTTDHSQVVFLDTPGIHRSDSLMNRRMMSEVRAAVDERDLLLFVADANRGLHTNDEQAIDLLKKTGTPALLVLNKIDVLTNKPALLGLIEQYRAKFPFAEYLPVSARTGDGLDELRRQIVKRLPEGSAFFPPDHITDQPERYLAAELIREQVLAETRQEVPHSIAVCVEEFVEGKALTRIRAIVYVEREGQKAIVIGAGGEMLKRVGTMARREIEELLGLKVFLELFVKVRANWRESPEFLGQLDWRRLTGNQGE